MEYGARPGDRLNDQERVLDQVADLVQDESVDHVLIAGDLFHRPKPTPAELLVAQRFLRRMKVGVTIIPGNHDYASASDPIVLDLFNASNVEVFAAPAVFPLGAVTLALLPWSPPTRLYAMLGGDSDRLDAIATASELLVEVAAGLRAQCGPGPAVLCLHWSVSGAVSSTGALADDFREPVLSASALEAQGWDAIVCGHLHRYQALGNGTGVPFFYTGSPAVCDFGEADHPHGLVLLDIEQDEPPAVTFVKLTDRPFVTVDDHIPDDLEGAVVRVRYTATPEQAREIDHDVIRQMAMAAGAHRVYAIQPTIVQADRARSAAVTDETGPAEAVDAYIASRELDSETSEQLRVRTPDFLERAR